MKNYYKILGVKKNASEEEIREHWVQLMRKLHPDQRMEGAVEDERIKEINEAYQVLKHSSTRVEYDLKRAYDQEKGGSYFRRVSLPLGIPIILLILAAVYLKSPHITIQQALVTQDKINQIDSSTQQMLRPNEAVDSSTQRPKDSVNATTLQHNNGKNPTAQRRIDAYTHPRIDPIDATTQLTQGHNDPMDQNIQLMQRGDDPINANMQLTQQPNGLITAVNQTDQIDQRNLSRLPRSESVRGEMRPALWSVENYYMGSIFHWDQINQKGQIDKKNERDQTDKIAASTRQRIDASTPLIATEEEVRHFFANYTERYTQKDLDGFLSLFSPRAVQNRQDGLEGIRKIYGNFFKQSQEIEYSLDDIKIEIYQNAAEVKARYELVQLLKKSGEKKIWRGDIRWTLVKEGGALKILSLDYQPQKSY